MNNVSRWDRVVIGLGPAGLAFALTSAHSGQGAGLLCVDAGVNAGAKFCTILQGRGCRKVQPCQITTGLGGSSVLSGGKISVYPAGRAFARVLGSQEKAEAALQRAHDLFSNYVPLRAPTYSDEQKEAGSNYYRQHGFDMRYYDAYTYSQKDLLTGYEQMATDIRAGGATIQLETNVTRLSRLSDRGFHLTLESSVGPQEIFTREVILAVGRHGEKLLRSLESEEFEVCTPSRVDVGVRLEFPSDLWPAMDACHKDLKLHFGHARTFCACKDGWVAPYRVDDFFLIEGRAEPDRVSDFSNIAVTVREDGLTNLKAEVRRQLLAQTRGIPIRQALPDFLHHSSPTSRRGKSPDVPSSVSYWRWGQVRSLYPASVSDALADAVEYFTVNALPPPVSSAATVFGPELDYYWPTMPIENRFASRVPGLTVLGDSTGLFRGILQAFCSGLIASSDALGRRLV